MSRCDALNQLAGHLPDMRAFAISLTRNRTIADDLVQDTLMTAWREIATLAPDANMRAWLFTILRNAYYALPVRQTESRSTVDDTDKVSSRQNAPEPLRAFNDAFGQLDTEQREALLLVSASGFSYQEAAQMCSVATSTIKDRISRAREILSDLMSIDDSNDPDLADRASYCAVNAPKALSC